MIRTALLSVILITLLLCGCSSGTKTENMTRHKVISTLETLAYTPGKVGLDGGQLRLADLYKELGEPAKGIRKPALIDGVSGYIFTYECESGDVELTVSLPDENGNVKILQVEQHQGISESIGMPCWLACLLVVVILFILMVWIGNEESKRTATASTTPTTHTVSGRASHCYNCKSPVDSRMHQICPCCGWIICARCGACGCQYYG